MGNTNPAAPEEIQPENNRGPIENDSYPLVSPTPTINWVSNQQPNDNLTMYFLLATIGLLIVIIAAQLWPRKNKAEIPED